MKLFASQDYPVLTCFYLELTDLYGNVPLNLFIQKCGFQDYIKSSATFTLKT